MDKSWDEVLTMIKKGKKGPKSSLGSLSLATGTRSEADFSLTNDESESILTASSAFTSLKSINTD